jgi:transcriptional/translational regulatory protein YebC/TACO1
MFDHKGLIKIDKSLISDVDEFEMELIDYGLDELQYDDDSIYIYTMFQDFGTMQKALDEKNIEVSATEFPYIPTNLKELDEEQQKEVNELIEAIEDDDDVQSVYTNMA